MQERDIYGLIGQIYDASLVPEQWPELLCTIAEICDVENASLVVIDPHIAFSSVLAPRADPTWYLHTMPIGGDMIRPLKPRREHHLGNSPHWLTLARIHSLRVPFIPIFGDNQVSALNGWPQTFSLTRVPLLVSYSNHQLTAIPLAKTAEKRRRT